MKNVRNMTSDELEKLIHDPMLEARNPELYQAVSDEMDRREGVGIADDDDDEGLGDFMHEDDPWGERDPIYDEIEDDRDGWGDIDDPYHGHDRDPVYVPFF